MEAELSKSKEVKELNKKIQLLKDEVTARYVFVDMKDYTIFLLREHLKFKSKINCYLNYFEDLEAKTETITLAYQDEHLENLEELRECIDQLEKERADLNYRLCELYKGLSLSQIIRS